MSKAINFNELLSQVEQMDSSAKLSLLEHIKSLLKKEPKKKNKISITQLNGLGKEIWKGVDIEKYVENERQW